jgi:hypothetical protein
MRRLLKWLAIILLPPILAAALFIVLASDDKPLVDRGEAISPAAVAQARYLLAANDPRRQFRGEIRTVVVPAALIDEGINYLAGRYLRGRGALALKDDTAEIALSIALPARRYLNLRTMVVSHEGKPHIAGARLGGLPFPAALLELGIARAVAASGFDKEWQLAIRALRYVSFDAPAGGIGVTYVWEPSILERARAAAMSDADIKRLRQGQLSFAALAAQRAPGSRVALAEVIKATFPTAGDDMALRGRATLLVLASQMAGKDLSAIVPAARNWPRGRWINITLAGRRDLAQHFVISATLVAWAGEPVADAIGLYKELEDARRGSGFSFIDLAADRAGTRFGEALIRNPELLIDALKGDFPDGQLLPEVADLPEFLHQPEFTRRFASPDSPQFKAMTEEIERRLDTLPLYR